MASTPPPPLPPSADELAAILPLLRKPELWASLKFVGNPVAASCAKSVLTQKVLAVLRGSEGSAKRDAIGENRWLFFLHLPFIGVGVGDFFVSVSSTLHSSPLLKKKRKSSRNSPRPRLRLRPPQQPPGPARPRPPRLRRGGRPGAVPVGEDSEDSRRKRKRRRRRRERRRSDLLSSRGCPGGRRRR